MEDIAPLRTLADGGDLLEHPGRTESLLERFNHTLAMTARDENDVHCGLVEAVESLSTVKIETGVPESSDKTAPVGYILECHRVRLFR